MSDKPAEASSSDPGKKARDTQRTDEESVRDPLEVALMTRFEEIEQYAECNDKREGELAGAERRKPVWTGR